MTMENAGIPMRKSHRCYKITKEKSLLRLRFVPKGINLFYRM